MKSFFSKKSILGTMAVAAVCMLGTSNAQAQEFTIQGDLVSSYVWRGIYQGGAASFQPTLGFSVGNFSLTAWGSTSLSESNKEIDLTAAYKFGEAGPTLSVATLWCTVHKWVPNRNPQFQNRNFFLIQHIQHSKKSIFIRVADGHIQYKIFHLNASQKF